MPKNFGKDDYKLGRIQHSSVEHDILEYPQPSKVIEMVNRAKSPRDRALISLVYLGALRISEALRLLKHQFTVVQGEDVADPRVVVARIVLSKQRKKGVERRQKTRDARLPLQGERAELTKIVVAYVQSLPQDSSLLFDITRVRAWQIVKEASGKWIHFFRAVGEQYLYESWNYNLIGAANYVAVSPRTFERYVHNQSDGLPTV